MAERKSALTAGISLILMALAAFFSYGFVHGSLVVKGNAATTFNNIVSSYIPLQEYRQRLPVVPRR